MKMVERRRVTKLSVMSVAVMVFLSGGMTPAPSEGPVNLNGLHVSGFAGYPVYDLYGVRVGDVISIDADARGRTRAVNISLAGAGGLTVSAFRAFLDVTDHEVSLTLPADSLYQRYDQQNPA